MPPQLSQLHPSIETSLKDPTFSDPYLSAPLDPDEADFRSSAIRLTPVPDGASSPCPSSDLHGAPSLDTASVDQSAFQPDNSNPSVLSPGDELLSNPSARGSPNPGHGMTGLNLSLNPAELSNWQPDQAMSHNTPDSIQLSSPQPILPSAQLLSPILTDNPSPTSDVTSHSFCPGSDALLSPESTQNLPPLITSPVSDALSVHMDPDSARARSPIVMVESVSRGDSPVRGANYSRRPSSAYLSPGDLDSDDDDEMDDGLSVVSRTADGSWVRDTTTGQAGVDPTSRGDTLVPSPNEMEAHRELGEKNAVIYSWTASVSEATSEAGGDEFLGVEDRSRKHRPGNRRRAKSAGDPSLQQDYFNYRSQFDDPSLPGPGVLVQEKSDDEESSEFELGSGSGSESPVASVFQAREDEMNHDSNIPFLNQPNPEDEEPLPSQFIRVRPWQDPARDPFPKATKMQPHNSSAAMMEFQRRARELDTASRFATWGTRNLSQVEVNGIIGGDSLERLSIGDADKGKKQERRSSLRNFLPRSTSPLKRQRSEATLNNAASGGDGVVQDDQNQAGLQRKTSTSSHRRKLSLGKPSRSPSLSAGGAMAAIAGGMASIGSGTRLSPGPSSRPTWPRGRSKSEIPLPAAPGLMDLMTSHGGPPVANPGYSATPRQSTDPEPVRNDAGGEDEEDDDEEGLVMEFPVQPNLPVPTLEGFKTQITQLNPRLTPVLLERLAKEQLCRYKKLVDHKSTHARVAGTHSCTSGNYCVGQGGEAKTLPPRMNAQDSDAAQTQFQIAGHGHDTTTDADIQILGGEGTVTAAQFPAGVPLPPVERLPAEFECPICFKVKKFQKPSDWSKHVHEDVQPFTCTFPRCNEPKSFKRKADWVRHENERHRQLEWWTCTLPDCHHTCYRKDNFVQHLVREHKMTEPKGKKASKTRGNDPVEGQQFWDLVEQCRQETTKSPRDEPCRFCGNVCSSWKKLTVHLAKHMEQLALPVLGLIQERDILPIHTNSSPAAIPSSIAPLTDHHPVQFGQSNSYSGSSTVHFNPVFTPSVTTPQDGLLSAEPEAMNPYEEMASEQFLHPGVEHHSPLHQNSVTYPPPFNVNPRPRTPNSIPDVNVYSPNPGKEEMEPVYDSQGPMYMSPTTEGEYSYPDPMATSLSYDSGVRNHMQNHYA